MRSSITFGVIMGILLFCAYTAKELSTFLSDSHSPLLALPYHPPASSPGAPIRLSIQKLGINAPVIPVGMDTHGLMDTPKNAEEIAWYKPGVTPGQNGNAVLAAHYDWVHGPAVFHRIGELQPDDELIVTDTKNQSWKFIVTQSVSYPSSDFPTEKVFASSNSPQLNLVTCDGIFNENEKSYQNRIVIYTKLAQIVSGDN